MYENVGKQIQKLAHVIRIVEIIFGVLLAFSTLSLFASSGDALTGVLTAILIIGIFIFIAWITNLRFYAYGVITERVEEQAQLLRYMAKGADTGLEKECPICGGILYVGDEFCSHCGTKMTTAQ